MLFSDVPFAALRKLLLDFGFTERAVPGSPSIPVPSLVFGHAESGAVFMFRTYRPQDRVSMLDLTGVRKQLDLRGLLSEEGFDAALRRASA
jgi:hypothetical protein